MSGEACSDVAYSDSGSGSGSGSGWAYPDMLEVGPRTSHPPLLPAPPAPPAPPALCILPALAGSGSGAGGRLLSCAASGSALSFAKPAALKPAADARR
eukprot:scaffold30287_cov42-Phaeocystis_antarctica.AAC.1